MKPDLAREIVRNQSAYLWARVAVRVIATIVSVVALGSVVLLAIGNAVLPHTDTVRQLENIAFIFQLVASLFVSLVAWIGNVLIQAAFDIADSALLNCPSPYESERRAARETMASL